MQVMSTTTTTITTTKKWKFRFTRGFMLIFELQGFYSGAKKTFEIFKCLQCYF